MGTKLLQRLDVDWIASDAILDGPEDHLGNGPGAYYKVPIARWQCFRAHYILRATTRSA